MSAYRYSILRSTFFIYNEIKLISLLEIVVHDNLQRKLRKVIERMKYEGWKVGQELRKLRKERGMSVDDLSCRLGMSRSHINQLEQGHRKMSMDLLYKIMSELDVDANTILVIPAKAEPFEHLSIDKQLERIPEEERMFLQKTFQYMINALPDVDEEL